MHKKSWEINSLIDNVPMRFSDKYFSFLQTIPLLEKDDVENLNKFNVIDYKFTAELVAIETFELYEKKRIENENRDKAFKESLLAGQQQQQQQQQDQQQQQQKHQQSLESSEAQPVTSYFESISHPQTTIVKQSSLPTANNVFYNMFSGSILQPQPLDTNFTTKSKATEKDHSINDKKELNPKEFENDDSSPFDNVELQSIDDLKELNQLFQAMNSSSDKLTTASTSNQESHDEISARAPPASTVPLNTGMAFNVNEVSSQQQQQHSQQSLYQNSLYTSTTRAQYDHNVPYLYNHSKGNFYLNQPYSDSSLTAFTAAPVPTAYVPQVYHPIPPQPPTAAQASMSYPAYTQSVYVSNNPMPYPYGFSNTSLGQSMEMKRSSSEKKDLSNTDAFEKINYCDYGPSTNTILRSSKSFSDLTNLNNIENNLNNNNITVNGIYGSNNSLNDRASLPNHLSSRTSVKNNNNSLPDPYDTLSIDERKFVDNLYQMGFQRDRVSRAVKHIGFNDDKKLFEYLLALQQLEDEGFHCYESEIALHMNNYNKNRAKEFLTSLRQICNLGFDKDTAIKALFKSNNDTDKAIETLCSRP